MDNEDTEATEPSSSHIYENSVDNGHDYLHADEMSERIGSSHVVEPDIDSEELHNDCYDEIYRDYQYSGRSVESDQAEQSLICDDYAESNSELVNHVIDEMEVDGHDEIEVDGHDEMEVDGNDEIEVDDSQPGCSSSSACHEKSGFHYFTNDSLRTASDSSSDEDEYDRNFTHSSYIDASSYKPADSNCLERKTSKGKGGSKISFKSDSQISFVGAPDDAIAGPSCQENQSFDKLVQSSHRNLLYAEIDSKANISDFNRYQYDSDSSSDGIDMIGSHRMRPSSPCCTASNSRNPPCFINEEETFMVASSSEGVCPLNETLQLKSPRTPGDSCIVSSSTGQLDSFPPTPLIFQENDASQSSSESSPLHPPVLDSTVDSTSGQNISSSYSVNSEDEHEQQNISVNFSDSAQDERNEISTSISHLQHMEDSCNVHEPVMEDIQENLQEENRSQFDRQCLTTISQSSDSNQENRSNEVSAMIPTSSSFIPQSLEAPGSSGLLVVPTKSIFAGAEQSVGNSVDAHSVSLCQVSEAGSAGSVRAVSFGVDTSQASSTASGSLGRVGLLGLEFSGMEVESSNVASSACLDSEEYPSGTEEINLNHSVSSFKTRTLTQLNQHYMLGIGDNSLSNSEDSMAESGRDLNNSSDQLSVRECLETDGDGRSSNFQTSLELGLGAHQLRGFSEIRQGTQSLLPPPHLLEEGHQIESSSSTVDFMESTESLQRNGMTESPSMSLTEELQLTSEVLPLPGSSTVRDSSLLDEFKDIIQQNGKGDCEVTDKRYKIEIETYDDEGTENIDSQQKISLEVFDEAPYQDSDINGDSLISASDPKFSLTSQACSTSTSVCTMGTGRHRSDSNNSSSNESLKIYSVSIQASTSEETPVAGFSHDSRHQDNEIISHCASSTLSDRIPVNIHSLFGNRNNHVSKSLSWAVSSFGTNVVATTDSEAQPKAKFYKSLFGTKFSAGFDSDNESSAVRMVSQFNDELEKNKAELHVPSNVDSSLDGLLTNANSHEDAELSGTVKIEKCVPSECSVFQDLCVPVNNHIQIDAKNPSDDQQDICAFEPVTNSHSSFSEQCEAGFWCSDCEKLLKSKCSAHRVQTIMDKPILSRAWASLPAQHLLIKQIPGEKDPKFIIHGVFSRKFIPKRTQFGPLEGIYCTEEPEEFSLLFKWLLNDSTGFIDISSEDSSNWMRFVRPAAAYMEMNCTVVEEDDSIFFRTTMNIQPKTELRVGYSKQYSLKYGLTPLTPTEEERQILEEMRKTWPCYECDESFETSAELQDHLSSHDKEENLDSKTRKRRKPSRKKKISIKSSDNLRQAKKIKTSDNSVENDEGKRVGPTAGTSKKDIYECPHCPLCFSNPELLKYHDVSHRSESTQSGGNEVYVDDVSNSVEENNQTQDLSESHTCPMCSVTFSSIGEISEHVKQYAFGRTKSAAPQNMYKCELCYKSFCREEQLKSHAEAHKNESEKPFSCYLCVRRFCNKSALGSHIKFHSDDGLIGYDCPICREKFSTVSELKLHFPSHCDDGCYTCPTCAKEFPSYFQIRRHIRSYHSDIIYSCPECGKELRSYQKFNVHMLIHSDKKEFGCPVCQKRFRRKDKMKEHLKRIHTQKKEPKKINPKFVPKMNPSDYNQFTYKCVHCLLGFKRRGMLVNHFAKRHPDIPISTIPELNQPILRMCRTYSCQYCGKTYGSINKRNHHIFKNHPGKDLPPSGSRGGDDPDIAVAKTMRTYAASCPWCPRQYMTKAKLLQHQRSHHSKLANHRYKKSSDRNDSQAQSAVEDHLNTGRSASSDAQTENYNLAEEVAQSSVSAHNDICSQAFGHCTNTADSKGRNMVGDLPQQVFSLEVSSNGTGVQQVAKFEQANIQHLPLSEPVVMSVSSVSSPVLIGGSLKSEDGTHPYVVLTSDGGNSYSLSLRPDTVLQSITSYPVLASSPSKDDNETRPNVGIEMAGSSKEDGLLPIDMTSSKHRNVPEIEAASSHIVMNNNNSLEKASLQFSVDIGSLTDSSCVLAQVQSQGGAEPSLVVCQPFISFTQPTP